MKGLSGERKRNGVQEGKGRRGRRRRREGRGEEGEAGEERPLHLFIMMPVVVLVSCVGNRLYFMF